MKWIQMVKKSTSKLDQRCPIKRDINLRDLISLLMAREIQVLTGVLLKEMAPLMVLKMEIIMLVE